MLNFHIFLSVADQWFLLFSSIITTDSHDVTGIFVLDTTLCDKVNQ
jgi:hypothetical protein